MPRHTEVPLDDQGTRLVEENYFLVERVLKAHWQKWSLLGKDELISELNWALVHAASSWKSYCKNHGYDHENVQFFPAYASRRLNGAIIDLMRLSDSVNRRTREKLKQDINNVPLPGDFRLPAFIEEDAWLAVPDNHNVEGEAYTNEILYKIREVISALPQEQKVILALHYYKGKELLAVAKEIGWPEHRVSRAHTAAIMTVFQELKKYLQAANLV